MALAGTLAPITLLMTLSPRLRRCVLTAHVATSVGWWGALLAYVALDVVAATSGDDQAVRAAYTAMAVVVSYVIVPLAVASVGIGILNAWGTMWGLLRHYWVLLKLVLTVIATTVLLIETRTVTALAEAATSATDPGDLPNTLVHSVGGLVVLTVVLVLSVFKPPGLTRYGWRKRRRRQA